MKEIWKDISGYEGLYIISNLGNIMSLKFGKTKPMYHGTNIHGYVHVNLSKNSKAKKFSVHRLVLLAFLGPSRLQVNHKNGIKLDNRLENLEYCTASENHKHRFNVLGHKGIIGKTGKDNPLSKKINQFSEDGIFIRKWDCIRDIERQLLIKNQNITSCCKGIYKTSGGFNWEYA